MRTNPVELDSDIVLDILLEDIEGMSKPEMVEYGMGLIQTLVLDFGLLTCVFGPKRGYLVVREILQSMVDRPDFYNSLADTARESFAFRTEDVSDVA